MSILPMPQQQLPGVLPEEMDLALGQQQLQRRRQVAQLLLQQAMTPGQGQMVSGHFVAPSKLQGVAQLLQGLAGMKLNKELDSKEAQLASQRQEALKAGLGRYFDTREGTPDQQMGPPTPAGEFGLQPGTKGNPRKAAIEAVVSSFPELRQLGAADLQNLGKQEQETFGEPRVEKDPATGKLILVRYGNKNTRQVVSGATPYEKPVAVNNQLVDPVAAKPIADFGDQWTEFTEGGKKYRRNIRSGKVELVDTGTSINVDTQGNKEALKQQGEVLKEARAQAISAKDTREAASRVMQALDDPQVMTGFAANQQLGVASLAKKLGWDDKQAVAKTQALASDLAKNVLNNAAALKPLSDSDIKFLKDVTGGNIALDAGTLRHLAGISYAAAHNALVDSYENYSSASTVQGGDEIVKLHKWPGFGASKLPEKLFSEIEGSGGRVRWQGQLFSPANGGAGAGTAAPPKRMTLEEAQQYYLGGGR